MKHEKGCVILFLVPEEGKEMWQIAGNGHSLTEQEERPVLIYKSVPGRRSKQTDGEKDLLDSKQTGDSLAAEHQAYNEIRRILEQLKITKISSWGENKYLKRKIYMGLMGLRNGCFRTNVWKAQIPHLTVWTFFLHSAWAKISALVDVTKF